MIKKIFLFIAIIALNPTMGNEKMPKKNDVINVFSDTIKKISENETSLSVQFYRFSLFYKVLKSNPHYNELKIKLEKYKTEEKKVKVTVTIPMMEIKDITEK